MKSQFEAAGLVNVGLRYVSVDGCILLIGKDEGLNSWCDQWVTLSSS